MLTFTQTVLALCTVAQIASARLAWSGTQQAPAFSDDNGDKVRGVNLGGWLVLENWMTPALFSVSPLDELNVPDEWSYCNALGKVECARRLEEHWSTYITEQDMSKIASLGLNTVRIPIGYWACDIVDEPYVQGQVVHLKNALRWAKTYDIDVMVDLHGLPGSQNGFDNSGILGDVKWASNSTNINRSLNALKLLTAEVTKSEFSGVVKSIEVINEPFLNSMKPGGATYDQLVEYYVHAYNAIRAIDSQVMVVFHDAFQPNIWAGFFNDPALAGNFTNVGLDTHIYQAFNGAGDMTHDQHIRSVCSRAKDLSKLQQSWTTIVGEFSLGIQTYCVDYKTCANTKMADNINNSSDAALFSRKYWAVQQTVYESAAGWIMWTWKTQAAPTWSYQTSVDQGWIPDRLTKGATAFGYAYNASEEECLIESYVAPIATTLASSSASQSTSVASTSLKASSPAQAVASATASRFATQTSEQAQALEMDTPKTTPEVSSAGALARAGPSAALLWGVSWVIGVLL